jgi:hypothetical protein
VKRPEFLESLRNRLPATPQLAPAFGGLQMQFASAGGGGGGDDDYPDDDFYDDDLPEEEPAPRRQRRTERRPTAARQRTVQTDPDERYWTDYLRIALPVIGLLLVIAVFWYWAQQLIDGDSGDLTPTAQPGVAEVVDTATEVATETPSTPAVNTGLQGQAPQGASTPAANSPLQAVPSPTPAQEQPAQEQPAGTDNQAETAATEEPATGGEIAPDMEVSVIEGPLNMRAEASTDSDIVVTLDTGAILTVTGGPEEGESYIWWNVVDQQGNTGWVAQEFIQPAS